MKKLSIILVLVTSIFLTGCTDQPINKGLYVISIVLLAAAGYCVYAVIKGYNTKTTQQTPQGIKEGSSGVIPWGYLFGLVFLLFCSIGSAKWIYEENRNYDPKKDKPYPEKPAPDGKESAEEMARKADSVYNLKK